MSMRALCTNGWIIKCVKIRQYSGLQVSSPILFFIIFPLHMQKLDKIFIFEMISKYQHIKNITFKCMLYAKIVNTQKIIEELFAGYCNWIFEMLIFCSIPSAQKKIKKCNSDRRFLHFCQNFSKISSNS